MGVELLKLGSFREIRFFARYLLVLCVFIDITTPTGRRANPPSADLRHGHEKNFALPSTMLSSATLRAGRAGKCGLGVMGKVFIFICLSSSSVYFFGVPGWFCTGCSLFGVRACRGGL